jgi:hypothetical protein
MLWSEVAFFSSRPPERRSGYQAELHGLPPALRATLIKTAAGVCLHRALTHKKGCTASKLQIP